MYWWRDPEQRTFEGQNGVAVTVIEAGDRTFYRVGPSQRAPQPLQDDTHLPPAGTCSSALVPVLQIRVR